MSHRESLGSFGIGARVESDDGYVGRLTGVVFHPASRRSAAIVHFEEANAPGSFIIPWRALRTRGESGRLHTDVDLRTMENCPLPIRSDREVRAEDWNQIDAHYGLADPVVEPDSPRPRVRSGLGPARFVAVLLLFLLIGLTGVFGYLVYDSGWAEATNSVETMAVEVKDRSIDAATTGRVKTALALSRSVSTFAVQVDTRDQIVTLSGTLPSQTARSVAIAIAEDTSGVKAVRDNLKIDQQIEPRRPEPDLAERVADLETKILVREALTNNSMTSRAQIRVEVDNGDVLLSGMVRNTLIASEAVRVARSVHGVQEVRSEIRVGERISS